MTFQSDKTGKHLRAQTLAAGDEERARALQALSHGYGKGCEAALASLLLATLGGDSTMGDNVAVADNQIRSGQKLPLVDVHKVAESMHSSANDARYDQEAAFSAS